jgi:hypothetical protein
MLAIDRLNQCTGFANADEAAALADVNTERDGEWLYVAVTRAVATDAGYVVTNGGAWVVMVIDEEGEVLGFL